MICTATVLQINYRHLNLWMIQLKQATIGFGSISSLAGKSNIVPYPCPQKNKPKTEVIMANSTL